MIILEGRIITLEPTSIAKYMAISETVQESVGQGYPITVFLATGWERRGVSIGERQRSSYVNFGACKEDDLEVGRRSTDGYAVVHYLDDCAYGIAIPSYIKSKRELDDVILPILVRSLARMGVPNCYDPFPRRYGNVFVNGRKISGSAQNTKNRNAWLQHGIISVRRHDAIDYVRCLNGEMDAAKIQAQMTSVEEEGGFVDPEKLVQVMAEEFVTQLQRLGANLKKSSLSPEELRYAEELTTAKYGTEEWFLFGTGGYDKSGRVGCFTWMEK